MNQVSFIPQLVDIEHIISNAIKLHSLDIELKSIKIQTDIPTYEGSLADFEFMEGERPIGTGRILKFKNEELIKTAGNNKFAQEWPKCYLFLYYKLIKFMQAEIVNALTPLQYKLAKR